MNENTYAKLEYEKIIDLLVNECSADLTKEKARELKPVTERKIVEDHECSFRWYRLGGCPQN